MQAIQKALSLAVRNAESLLYMMPVCADETERRALKTEIRTYRVGLAEANAAPALPTYEECGCCGHLHRPEFGGDCRDDTERFSAAEFDDIYGPGAWIEQEITA